MRYQSILRIPLQIMIILLVEKCKDRPNFHSTILIAEISMMELLAPMENLADKLARLKGTAIPSKSLEFPFFYWLLSPASPAGRYCSPISPQSRRKCTKGGKVWKSFPKWFLLFSGRTRSGWTFSTKLARMETISCPFIDCILLGKYLKCNFQ